jgi:hypothetical protein
MSMSTRANSRTGSARVAVLGLGLIVLGAAAGLALSTGPAAALPNGGSCIVRTYYSSAEMTQQVGSWSNCPGHAGLKGRRTAYFEDDTLDLTPPKPIGAGGSAGGLPCEFVQEDDPITGKPLKDYSVSQCYNLPIPR